MELFGAVVTILTAIVLRTLVHTANRAIRSPIWRRFSNVMYANNLLRPVQKRPVMDTFNKKTGVMVFFGAVLTTKALVAGILRTASDILGTPMILIITEIHYVTGKAFPKAALKFFLHQAMKLKYYEKFIQTHTSRGPIRKISACES